MNSSTEGLVLRVQKAGDNDRLCTLLTEKMGLVRAFAKGAARMKHKNFAATTQFAWSSFEVFSLRGRYSIDEALCVEGHFPLRGDAEKLALAAYLCELCIALVPEEQPAPEFCRLMRAAFYYLAAGRAQGIVKAAAEMRMMALSGLAPNLLMCGKCGRYDGDVMFFLPFSGELRCGGCGSDDLYDEGGTTPPLHGYPTYIELVKGSLTALRHTVYAEFDKTFSFSIPGEGVAALNAASESYLLHHLEREFKTLEIYKRLIGDL